MSHVNTGLWFCLCIWGFFCCCLFFNIFDWPMLCPIATYTPFINPYTYIMLKFFPPSKMRRIRGVCNFSGNLVRIGKVRRASWWTNPELYKHSSNLWTLGFGYRWRELICSEWFRNRFWLGVFGCNRSIGALAGESQFVPCPLRVLGVCNSVLRGLGLVPKVIQYHSYFHVVLN